MADQSSSLVGASPPIPGYIRDYVSTSLSLATSAHHKRQREDDAPLTLGTSGDLSQQRNAVPPHTFHNTELFTMLDEVMAAYRSVLDVLARGGVASNDDNNDEAEARRVHEVRAESADWAAKVAVLQHGIRSKGAVCVKRSIRDRLQEEIAEKMRAIRKMESTIDTAQQMI
ncbi:Hypothetical protein, putative [Bodo saltans]|uniref:Uncharacterized protein n=1 Tax=Bodo saltans TaxID=75058 RepID=A0A0S4JW51_BODSA|nr:Hypothetical protein, putative [Bodo saltans]|eukprot:CUG94465.1 Hypothetical protein, putative [Bodo saltans]